MSFKNLGDLLNSYMVSKKNPQPSYQKYTEGFDFLSLIQSWKDIVGKQLGSATLPLRIRNTTLFIITEHSAYASELQFLEKDILKKVFVQYPYLKNQIKSLKFQASPYFNKIREEQLTKVEINATAPTKTLHRLDPEYLRLKEEAQGEIAHVDDPELKSMLEELYINAKAPKN